MRFKSKCEHDECMFMDCTPGQVLVSKEGNWECEGDDQGDWTQYQSPHTKIFHPELPFKNDLPCKHCRLSPFEKRYVQWKLNARGAPPFHASTWDTSSLSHRSDSNKRSSQEEIFYCEYPRLPRRVYWLLRPLCILSALLFLTAIYNMQQEQVVEDPRSMP